MTHFHEGQEVKVATRMTSAGRNGKTFAWRKAKIIGSSGHSHTEWMVEFRDGTRGVFGASEISLSNFLDEMSDEATP